MPNNCRSYIGMPLTGDISIWESNSGADDRVDLRLNKIQEDVIIVLLFIGNRNKRKRPHNRFSVAADWFGKLYRETVCIKIRE